MLKAKAFVSQAQAIKIIPVHCQCPDPNCTLTPILTCRYLQGLQDPLRLDRSSEQDTHQRQFIDSFDNHQHH
jgi:hypothetical protein